MAKSYALNRLNKINTLFLLLTPLAAILGIVYWLMTDGFQIEVILLAVLFYYLSGLGITAGYHRLFAHRAYKSNTFYKILMLILGGCAVQNSALKWCNDHRVHHTKVDTDHDPYNIKEGFFFAHMGWILLQENIEDFRYSRDLVNDKWVMLQHKYYIPMIGFFSFALPGLITYFWLNSFWSGFFVAGFARIVFVHHCTFFINSLCHMLGTRPYDTHQTARDSWIMALFTFGEGYHNYHHTFQADYRNGIRWYHYDPTKWLIFSMSKLGIVSDLKTVKEEEIIAKMIEVNLEKLSDKKSSEYLIAAKELISTKLNETKHIIKQAKDASKRSAQNELMLLLKQSKALVTYNC